MKVLHYHFKAALTSHEVWEAKNPPYESHTIRIWPIYDQPDGETRYKCQDGFGYTWFLSGLDYQNASQNGFDH